MRRFRFVALALVLTAALVAPALAQTPIPVGQHPAKGDSQFVGDLTWEFRGSERTRRLEGSWFKMTGWRQKTGVSVFGARDEGATLAGAGPSYQVMLGRFPKGALWGGGTLFLYDAAPDAGSTGGVQFEAVYELYLGKVAALRIGGRYVEPLDVIDQDLADEASGVFDLFVGFGIFVNQDAYTN